MVPGSVFPEERRPLAPTLAKPGPAPTAGDGRPPAVELEGIAKRFPGVVANRDVRPAGRRRHDPRHRRRERRRQVDPDEDPLRDAAPRRGQHHRRRAPRSRSARPPTPSRPASAWCTSTSCWPTTSPCSRTSSSAPSPARRSSSTGRRHGASIVELGAALRPRRRPRRHGRDARRRRPPAGRDPQGPLPRRPHPDPRRAHRRARAPGGRGAVRATSRELKREGVTDPVHLPQARRGARRSPTPSP